MMQGMSLFINLVISN